MNTGEGVSAEELIQALTRRRATLPAEIGTFVVLEGCEAMLSGGPRELAGPAHVRISAQGGISLSGPACDDEPGARALHRLLKRLLAAAGPRLPPALAHLSEEGPRGEFSLGALRDELEAALVPLNRHASRRVLARFVREAIHPPIHPDEVDAALDSLLGAGDAPANDVSAKASQIRPRGPAVPLQVDLFEDFDLDLDPDATPVDARAGTRERSDVDARAGMRERDDVDARGGARERSDVDARAGMRERSDVDVRAGARERGHAEQPEPKRAPSPRPSFAPRLVERERRARHDSNTERLVELSEAPASSSRKLFFGLALIALAIAAVALALAVQTRRTPQSVAAPAAAPASAPAAGDLVVHVSQPNAQVLRFVGRAPATVERLPVGVAHEFAATAEGFRPARVLVPAEADWEATPEGARYEVALQLAPIEGAAAGDPRAQLELGPSRLASQASATTTRLGTVRVVATPRGARVYQLVGFSPEVRVQDVPLAGPQELLVYREGYAPVVRVVSPSDFKPAGTRLVAELQVELEKRPNR